ncbi:MAG: hypothetical protein LBV29_03100 [Azoarcus sp.]|jgi:DNA polymerase|nr:hypothetical protein [Azoarcus sp.]
MRTPPKNIVTLDFETYYSADYTLSKPEYNTSHYIRDPQFKAHCCAIKINDEPCVCYEGDEIKTALKKIDWNTHALLAHNTAFDGFILSCHYGIVPMWYYDTLSMTRGLHNEVSRGKLDIIAQFYGLGEKHKGALENTKGKRALDDAAIERLMSYCVNDTELCYEVFKKQIEVYPADELALIDMTIRMFCDPVLRIDEQVARTALAEEMLERRATILRSGATEEELQSSDKFAAKLREAGIVPPTKISNATGVEIYAFAQTDPEFTDLLAHENLAVVRLIQARLAAKSTQAETRAFRLLQAGADGNRLPVGYNYFGAKTGRWSGTNKLNLQNLPRVVKKEPKPSDGLRRCILAPDKHVLVVTDSAQIEARVNAWLCEQNDLTARFAAGEDVYKHMASSIYSKPVDTITSNERFIGKTAVLGLGYGMGPHKFKTTLALGLAGPEIHLPLNECQRIVRMYRANNYKIAKAWKTLNTVLERMMAGQSGEVFGLLEYDPTTVWLPNGMGLHYPGLHKTATGEIRYKANNAWKKIYGGLLIENIVQALARIVIGEQMLATQNMLDDLKLRREETARVVLMTHDEIVTCVPERLADKVLSAQLDLMRVPPHNWGADIPLNAEGGYAINYSK